MTERWNYCKTAADGIPCVGLNGESGCEYHNSPEHCKKVQDKIAKDAQASGDNK